MGTWTLQRSTGHPDHLAPRGGVPNKHRCGISEHRGRKSMAYLDIRPRIQSIKNPWERLILDDPMIRSASYVSYWAYDRRPRDCGTRQKRVNPAATQPHAAGKRPRANSDS